MKDIKEIKGTNQLEGDMEILDKETEKRVGKALKDIEEGHYTDIKTDKELKEYFLNIDKYAKEATKRYKRTFKKLADPFNSKWKKGKGVKK